MRSLFVESRVSSLDWNTHEHELLFLMNVYYEYSAVLGVPGMFCTGIHFQCSVIYRYGWSTRSMHTFHASGPVEVPRCQ